MEDDEKSRRLVPRDAGTAGWHPTDEEFAAYKQREIELAMANLNRAKNFNIETLHSSDTVQQACKILRSDLSRGL